MAIPTKDAIILDDAPNSPMLDEQSRFILKYDKDKEEYEFVMSEFLRINAVYWALTAMDLMGQREKVNREEVSQLSPRSLAERQVRHLALSSFFPLPSPSFSARSWST